MRRRRCAWRRKRAALKKHGSGQLKTPVFGRKNKDNGRYKMKSGGSNSMRYGA